MSKLNLLWKGGDDMRNCPIITEEIKKGKGIPRFDKDGKCLGYAQCKSCKVCKIK